MSFLNFRRGLFSYLATIDVFGKAVELNFNRSKKSRTRAGGLLTLLFLGFWIWSIYNVGKDIFQRNNPKMTTADIISVDPKPLTINSDLFTIAFGYADPISASHYKNDSIFTLRVSVSQMHRNIHSNGTITLDWTDTVLETETCTPSHFGELAADFAPLQLDQLTCIKKNQPAFDPIIIQGAYGSEVWRYLQVLVFPCNQNTSAVACGTDDELEFFLGGEGYFAAYFTDMAVNMKDYKKPITRFQNSIFTLFGNKGYKELYYTINPVEIVTDSGWFTKEETIEQFAKYEVTTETTTVAVKDTLLKFRVKVSPTSKIYSRSYIKIQEIFAQANGLATVALMVLLFVITPYANLKFNESIINELFEVNSSCPAKAVSDPQARSPGKNRRLQQHTTNAVLSTMAADRGFGHLSSQRPLFDKCSSPRTPAETDRESVPNEAKPSTALMSSSPKKSMTILPLRSLKNASISADSPRKENNNLNDTPRKSLLSPNLQNNPSGFNFNAFGVNKLQVQKPTNKLLELKNVEIMLDNFSLSEHGGQDQENPDMVEFKPFNTEDSPSKLPPLEIPAIKGLSNSESEGDESIKPEIENNDDCDASFEPKIKNIAQRMSKEEGGLNITFWDYLQSFVRKSPRYKEKLKLLNAGIEMVNERLNIFELFQNFREIEKLKLLLLDYEQAVLFENLPKPLLHAQADESADPRSCYEQLLRTGRLVSQDKKSLEVCEAYKTLAHRHRKDSSEVDSKLLRVYNKRFT